VNLGQSVRVGDAIRGLTLPPLTASTLGGYAEASGDHAAVHLDPAYARAMGFPDVIAHGLLVMAYLGRALTDWQPVSRLRSFSCRFVAVALPGERLACHGIVAALHEQGDEQLADLELEVRNEHAELKLKGRATVLICSRSAAHRPAPRGGS
jgi:acyl dehydratase